MSITNIGKNQLIDLSINTDSLMLSLKQLEKGIFDNNNSIKDIKQNFDRINLIKEQVSESLIKIEANEVRFMMAFNTMDNFSDKIKQIENRIEETNKQIEKVKENIFERNLLIDQKLKSTSNVNEKGISEGDVQSIKCCYKKKSQFLAFLLETLIGFGIGHFFIGNFTLGVIKMCFMITICCSCCLIGFCFCYKSNRHNEEPSNKQKILNIIFLASIVVYFIWQLVDMVLFGINYYTDVNGVAMETW